MAEITTQFRAALHGYNREDVVDFIDRMTHAHEDALDRLQKANAKLKEELAEANEALAAAKNNQGSEKALSDAQNMVDNLRRLNEDLQDRNQSLEEKLTQLRAEREAEALPATLAHEEEVDRLKKENLMLRTELADVNDALNTLKSNKDAETAFSEARAAIADLRTKNEQQNKRIRSLEEELQQACAERDEAISSKLDSGDAEIERLKKSNEELRQELAATNEAFIAANDSLTAANEALAKANEALAAAKNQPNAEEAVSEARAAIAELTESKEALESRIRSLEEERETNAELLAQAQEQLRSERETNAELLEQTQEQLRSEREANAQLLAQVQEQAAAQKTDVETGEPAKDYAELELAAYRRAEKTERLARDRAGEVYRQIQSVFGQANETMGSCHEDLAQLCQVLTSNVNELQAVLTRLNSSYHETEKTFAEIGARDRELMEENI